MHPVGDAAVPLEQNRSQTVDRYEKAHSSTALFIISISALVAAILALGACALLFVAVLHLEAVIQNLASTPVQSNGGFLVP